MGEKEARKKDMVRHAPYFREAIFRTVFAEPKYLLELYKALDPEKAEKITVEDITPLSMTSVPGWCYDVIAFVAGDELVMVQDAGSEWSDVRLSNGVFYIAEGITGYAEAKGIDLYSDTPRQFPTPACFVLYAGDEEDGEQIDDGAEVECSLGALHYEPTVRTVGTVPGDIIEQYLAAGIVCDELGDKYEDPEKAAEEIARECLERGFLPQYFVVEE